MSTNAEIFLSIAGASAGLIGLIAATWAARRFRRLQARCVAVESALNGVRRELELVASISLRTGRRLKSIEHRYSGVAERVDQVELRGPAPSFDQAIDSARRGVDPGKLAQTYGLSRGEADLVARLHGRANLRVVRGGRGSK